MRIELSGGAKQMLALVQEGPKTMFELAKTLNRSPNTARTWLRELQAAGLAYREGGPGAWGRVRLSNAIPNDPQAPPSGFCVACGDSTARGRKNKDGTRQLTGHYCPACKQALRADHVLLEAACVIAHRKLARSGKPVLDFGEIASIHIHLDVPLWGDPEAPTREGKQGLVSWLVSRGLADRRELARHRRAGD